MCNEKRAQSKQLETDLLVFLHKPINCLELALSFLRNWCHLQKMWLIPPQHKKNAREADSSGFSVLREENRLLRVHQLYTTGKKIHLYLLLIVMKRGRIIGKVPCLDLRIKQLRRAGEGGDTARGREKETKPCWSCRGFFCLRHRTCFCFVSVLPDHLFPG